MDKELKEILEEYFPYPSVQRVAENEKYTKYLEAELGAYFERKQKEPAGASSYKPTLAEGDSSVNEFEELTDEEVAYMEDPKEDPYEDYKNTEMQALIANR